MAMTLEQKRQLAIQSLKEKMINKMKKIKSSDDTIENVLYNISDEAERNLLRIFDYCHRQFEYQCNSFELDNTIFIPNIYCNKNKCFYILNFIDQYRDRKQKIINEFINLYPDIKIKRISLKQYRRIITWFQDDILFESEKYKVNFSSKNKKRIKCNYCGKKFISNNNTDKYCSEECAINAHNNKTNKSILRRYYSGYYMDIHHYVRSGWEHNIARILQWCELDYDYECHTFKLSNGTYYTPDFYVYADDIFYEIKGEMRTNTLAKYNMFKEEYPEKKLIIINEKTYKALLKQFPNINFTSHVMSNQPQLKNISEYRHNQISYENWELDYKFYTNRRYIINDSIDVNSLQTIQQLSNNLNLTINQIHYLIKFGQIIYYLIDNNYYFDLQDVNNYINNQSTTFLKTCTKCHTTFVTSSNNIQYCNNCNKNKYTLNLRLINNNKYYFMDIHHSVRSLAAHNIARVLQINQLNYDYGLPLFVESLNDWLIIDFYVYIDNTYYIINDHNNGSINNKFSEIIKDSNHNDKHFIILNSDIIQDILYNFNYINFKNHINLLDKYLYQQDPNLILYLNKKLNIDQNIDIQKTLNLYKTNFNNVTQYRTDNVFYYSWELDYRLYTNRRKLAKNDMISLDKLKLPMFSQEEIIDFIQQGILIFDYVNDTYAISKIGLDILKNDLNTKTLVTCQFCGKQFYTFYSNYSKFCSQLCLKRMSNKTKRTQKIQTLHNELSGLDESIQGQQLHQLAMNNTLKNNMLNIDSQIYSIDQIKQLISNKFENALALWLKNHNIHYYFENECYNLQNNCVLIPKFFLPIDNTYYFITPISLQMNKKIKQWQCEYPDKKIIFLTYALIKKLTVVNQNTIQYNIDDYYTVGEACDILDISRTSLMVYCKKQLIKYLKINASASLYEKQSVINLLNSNILKPKKFQRTCQFCKKIFLARTSFAKFCSWKCYKQYQNKN